MSEKCNRLMPRARRKRASFVHICLCSYPPIPVRDPTLCVNCTSHVIMLFWLPAFHELTGKVTWIRKVTYPLKKKEKEKYGSNLEGLMRSSHEDTYFIILSRSNGSYNNSRVLVFSWFLHMLRVEFEVSYRKLNSLMQNVRDIS